jgi:hypothetical protein
MTDTKTELRTIGLVLVHGIGDQAEGKTTDDFIVGITAAFPKTGTGTVEEGGRKFLCFDRVKVLLYEG